MASLLDVPATVLAAARVAQPAEYSGFDLVRAALGTNAAAPSSARSPSEPEAAAPEAAEPEAAATTATAAGGQPPPPRGELPATMLPRGGRTAVAATDFLGYGVATATWKLLYYPQRDEGFLFHRRSDPSDRVNRFNGTQALAGRTGEGTGAAGPEAAGAGWSDAAVSSIMLRALLRWRARQVTPALLALTPPVTGPVGGPRSAREGGKSFRILGTDAELDLMSDLAELQFMPTQATY